MNRQKALLLVIVIIEWFALIAQFSLHIQAAENGIAEQLIRFFSFFTISTNILVAIYATVRLLTPASRSNGFFFSPSVETAIALYITVVGLIYNLVLRQLWTSCGLQAVLHDLLHSVIPILVIIYWWLFVNARLIKYANIPAWLIYPAVYAVYSLVRGAIAGWYPYPFLNVLKLGYPQVFINCGVVVLVFLVFSFAFVFIGQRKPIKVK